MQIMVWKSDPKTETGIRSVDGFNPAASLDEISKQLPAGVYTTFRTYGKYRVLRLSDHFRRIDQSAILQKSLVTVDEGTLRANLNQALSVYPADEMRVRLTLDLTSQPGDVYFSVEALKTPTPRDYQDGVRVITRRLQRSNPKSKATNFINTAGDIRGKLPTGVHEVLMTGRDACILEGLSSNFFAIANGEIWTAEEGVLNGITRSIVLEIIRRLKIPFHMQGLLVQDLTGIQEAFLTSTSRGVLPISQIDGHPLTEKIPGPLTSVLATEFQKDIESQLEAI